jgi:HlyD family secretion protein
MSRTDLPPGASRSAHDSDSTRLHLAAVGIASFAFVAGVVGLGAATSISGAVIAAGSVVVEGNVRKVQHRTGGIVAEIYVRDGQRVTEGELLVRLDQTLPAANLAAVTKSFWELTARQARMEAERDGSAEVNLPAPLVEAIADQAIARIAEGERALFKYRLQALHGQKAQLAERMEQLRNEVGGLEEQLRSRTTESELIGRELGGVMELWQKNLVPITRLTALERERSRLSGERGMLVASIAQSRGRIAETELQILQLDQNRRSEAARELAEVRARLGELVERRAAAIDELMRIDIVAPQAGYVHQLAVHTRGGVVAPGEQLMLVVPRAEPLQAEMRVSPQDIGQIEDQQAVKLRFPSFDFRTTPELDGTIEHISADTSSDPRTGSSHYIVRVNIAPDAGARLGRRLVPGMPVDAFIQTKARSMLSYLTKPLVDQARRAFAER